MTKNVKVGISPPETSVDNQNNESTHINKEDTSMKYQVINGTIYLWTNLKNGKCYAGLTVRPVGIRKREHITESKRDKPRTGIARAIREHRYHNFNFCILHANITDWAILNQLEIEEIDKHDAYRNGYNYHPGGQGEFSRVIAWEKAEEIGYMYTKQGMSTAEIGKRFRVSNTTICKILEFRGIPRRSGRIERVWNQSTQIAGMYTDQEMTTLEIAESFNVSVRIIIDILDSLDIPRRGSKKEQVWRQAETIADMYTRQRMSTVVIGQHFGVGSTLIATILNSLDIPRRTNRKEEIWGQSEQIINMYTKQRMSTIKIAEIYNCDSGLILRILRSHRIPIKPNGWYWKGKPSCRRHQVWKQPEQVIDMYTRQFMSTYEVAEHFGIDEGVINRLLETHGISRRTGRQSQLLRLKRELLKWQLTFDF